MASGQSLFYIDPRSIVPDVSGADVEYSSIAPYAPYVAFDCTLTEAGTFPCWMPSHYTGGSGIKMIFWHANATVAGVAQYKINFNAFITSASVGDTTYDTTIVACLSAPSADDRTFTTITIPDAATDSIAAGFPFTVLLRRDANNAATEASADSQIFGIYLEEV